MTLIAILLGVIEGLTEFLPISSTGHLILAGHALGFTGQAANTFEVVIQLGAILAVVWEYRRHLLSVVAGIAGLPSGEGIVASRGLALNLAIAFLPAAVAGLLLHDYIETYLFGPITVCGALIVGGVAMLAIERMTPRPAIASLMAIPRMRALAVGCAQVLALFPGVSRAAATIMGGMIAGLDRRTATEFSFYLAIPTMLAATAYDLMKSFHTLTAGDFRMLVIGFVVAFVSARVAVRGFIRYIARHDFRPFAWYRIALGFCALLYFSR